MSPIDRPLRPAHTGRRALGHVGGPVESHGERALVAVAREAFEVRAGERDATLSHPFHAYPARLHPEVARRLVAYVGTMEGDERPVVLDPFCGSGTVLVEAMAGGLCAVGSDLSPLAIELASLKTRVTLSRERRTIVSRAILLADRARERLASGAPHEPVPRGESEWFAPHVLAELAMLASSIRITQPGLIRDAMRLLFSSILVKVSRQASDTDLTVTDKAVAPGDTLRWFARKAYELDHALAAFSHAVPPGTPPAAIALDDATRLARIADGSIDAVITSPPYANTYDYVQHHARRYAWLELDDGPLRAHEIGAARWFNHPTSGVTRFDRDLGAFVAAMARVLVPGGLAFVVIADGAVGETPLPADECFVRACGSGAVQLVARMSQSRPNFSAEVSAAFARQPKREHLLVLRRT